MDKLKILFLSNQFNSNRSAEEQTAGQTAVSLAAHAHVKVILPNNRIAFNQNTLEVIGLDTINISEMPARVPKPEPLPYSDAPYIRPMHSLYGSDKVEYFTPESVLDAHFAKPAQPILNAITSNQEVSDIFSPENFATLSANRQVIEYARYTCRLVAGNDFDIIYAFDWQTYLAGMELKLISGKELIIQVSSFSYEHPDPNSKGWMFEIEKQAYEKADVIWAADAGVALILESSYGINPAKIFTLEKNLNLDLDPANNRASIQLLRLLKTPLVKRNRIPLGKLSLKNTSGEHKITRKKRNQNNWQKHLILNTAAA